MGRITFVGAGPGDCDLITVKGLRALEQADIVLYDALVSPALLNHCPEKCKRIFVGKRKGKKEFPQEEINQLLVFYAQRFSNVVRLKGGDPYVFGRGHEELLYVTGFGIATEMIPGVSSAIAAPSSAGIPITKRGVNESFWVITGTLSCGSMSGDIQHAARSSATIIILMGVTHLARIAQLIAEFRSVDEPMALIEQATLPTQKVVTGTAATIAHISSTAGINSPAVIVIGNVVRERDKLLSLISQSHSIETSETL